MDERLRPPWAPWEAVPVAVAAIAATTLASVALAAAFGSVGGPALLLSAMAFQVTLATLTVVWVGVRHRGWVPALGLRAARPERDVPLGAVVGVGLWAGLNFLVAPVVLVVWRAVAGRLPSSPNQLPGVDFAPLEIVLGALLLVVVTPIAEEVFYRGLLFGSLWPRIGTGWGAVISAALFGASHAAGGAVLVPILFVFGLFQAFLFRWRRSLAAPIVAHGTFNLIAMVLIVLERS
jgi:membrane protease YdiL (CAAX protease family)